MKIPYKFLSFPEAIQQLDSTEKVFADTETVGFYGTIRLLQLMQAGWDSVVFVEWPTGFDLMRLCQDFDVAWYNAHYDITTAQQNMGKLAFVPERITDLFLLARIGLPRLDGFTFEDVVIACVGSNPYAGLDKKVMQKTDWGVPKLTESQLQYAATDVWYMPDLWYRLQEFEDSQVYQLDIHTLKYCLDFQWNGLPVDQDRLAELQSLQHAIVDSIGLPVNANSPKQVCEWLGIESSGDLILAKMELAGNERAGNVRKVRKARKLLSFLDKFDTDIIYGKFKPSAKSGRLTSDDQNLQQLPRAAKGVFGVAEDQVMIYADYPQLELRTIAAIVNCTLMIKLFREGGDLHSITAEFIFGEITKIYRQVAKTANFNLLYGGGVGMFLDILVKSAELLLPEEEGRKVKRKWLNLWREINAWQQKRIGEFNSGKLGSTPLGRPYSAQRMTDYLNIENQGAGAEVAKLALHYYYKSGARTKYPDFKVANFIHDSFILIGPNDPEQYKAVAILLAKCMQRAWFQMSRLFQVHDLPMPINIAVGHNWGDIEDDDIPNLFDFELEPHATMNSGELHA